MTDEELAADHDYMATHLKLAGIAARHVAPEHIDNVLTHYAGSLKARRTEGLTNEQLNAMTDEEHEAFFADYAKAHPEHARTPDPPESTRRLKSNGLW